MTGFDKREKGDRARDLARGSYLFRVTEDILVAMEDLGVTKSELAKRLGKSKPRITQLLSGSSNMTIGTLSDIAVELGLNLDKTFKEYSVQRYRLDTDLSSEQTHTDPGFTIASIK
jgi:transcriptional regulator with XRE-family HTH domain